MKCLQLVMHEQGDLQCQFDGGKIFHSRWSISSVSRDPEKMVAITDILMYQHSEITKNSLLASLFIPHSLTIFHDYVTRKKNT